MAREGTRSATGNSSTLARHFLVSCFVSFHPHQPRVFQTIDTEPAIKRTTKPKKAKASPTATTPASSGTKAAKPAGVTKKTTAPKKPTAAVGAKVKAAVKKVESKAKGEPKTKKTAAAPKPKVVEEEK
ncbi:hypothetical protein SLS62_003453 [Diatrype stigma]|uniref:Uncharacterized protein n=1 Tax=Diatrype stigma TaxID=117547 RepID=A0AAN9V6I9_9PEZI